MKHEPTPPASGPPPFSPPPPSLHRALIALQQSIRYQDSAEQYPDRHDHHLQARVCLREAAALFGPAFARTIDADLREIEENRHIVHAMPINTMRLWVAHAISLQAKLDALQLDDQSVKAGLNCIRGYLEVCIDDNEIASRRGDVSSDDVTPPEEIEALQRLILALEGWSV